MKLPACLDATEECRKGLHENWVSWSVAAEEVDIETVLGRSRAFAEFLHRHPGADPGGALANYVEGVGKTGSAVL